MPILGRSLLLGPEPFRGEVLCLLDAFDDMLVQPFMADRSVVALEIRVLLRLARLDVLDADVALSLLIDPAGRGRCFRGW